MWKELRMVDEGLDRINNAIDKILINRKVQPKRINVKYVDGRCISKAIKFRNHTHIIFFDNEVVSDLLAFDYEMGVQGERAFDPGERPF